MRDLADLTVADFQAVTGSEFEVVSPGADSVGICLAGVNLLGERPGHRQPFSLRFRGPSAPILPQATCHMRHGELGELAAFITPVAADADSATYQAVFS